jgi:hypothetical protein
MKITKYDLIWHIAEYEHVCASSFLQLLVPVVFTTDRSADAQKFWEGVALLHSIQGTYQHMQMVRVKNRITICFPLLRSITCSYIIFTIKLQCNRGKSSLFDQFTPKLREKLPTVAIHKWQNLLFYTGPTAHGFGATTVAILI